MYSASTAREHSSVPSLSTTVSGLAVPAGGSCPVPAVPAAGRQAVGS